MMNQIYEIGLKSSETAGKHAYPIFIFYLKLSLFPVNFVFATIINID